MINSNHVLYFVAATIASEVVYLLYRKCINKRQNETEVLFFPDKGVACKDYLTAPLGCERVSCGFSHENTSLGRLYTCLASSKRSLDVCVFVITCSHLADVLIDAVNRGVRVRVITDSEQMQTEGSEVWRLRSQGVHVRTDESSFFMHHKFVIIDNSCLINGSFNWTRQAITGNQENLIITKESAVVQAFREEYQKLWQKFDPHRHNMAKKF